MEEPSSSGTAASPNDYHALQTAWINERHAPDLLPHQDDLLGRIKEAISKQEARIEELGDGEGIARSLYEMELERVNFQFRNYLRTRLEKISRMAIWASQQAEAEAEANPEAAPSLLSPAEANFLRKYLSLYQDHINAEAWDKVAGVREELPSGIRQISAVPSLVIVPDMSSHVFCRALRSCEPFTLPNSTQVLKLSEGDIVLLPYQPVRHLLLNGSIQLT